VPTIKEFNGFRTYMYFADHGRPHFHIVGPDFVAAVAIDDLSVLAGEVPGKAREALAWAGESRAQLMDYWNEYSGQGETMSQESKRLKDVKPGDERFTLVLEWRDGTAQTVDLSGLVAGSRHFHRFVDEPGTFRDARVINWGHGIEWPNGLDYSAENLAQIAGEQEDGDDREAFVAWQTVHRLTNEEAGAILGYKKSQIKNFRSGEANIPVSVMIAMRAFDADPTMFFAHYRPCERALSKRKKPAAESV